MKDVSGIFQFPFIAESGKSSQPNDFSISGERFSVLRQMKWSLAERYLKHPSACNINIMSGLRCNLKNEVSFAKFLCKGDVRSA